MKTYSNHSIEIKHGMEISCIVDVIWFEIYEWFKAKMIHIDILTWSETRIDGSCRFEMIFLTYDLEVNNVKN